MADLLSIGVSGLLAYQRALDAVGHNIANANTEGYSRQRVELTSRPGSGAGHGFIGSGVNVTTVRRLADSLLSVRMQADASAHARLEVFSGFAARIDGLLSESDTGLAAPLQAFYDAANALAQQPTAIAARQTLIGNAQALAARFRDLQAQLDAMDAQVDQRIRTTVEEINGLAGAIADLNRRIATDWGRFGQPPNDLLDQRDQLLQQLAARIGISTVAQADGTVNVYTASGQALVLGEQGTALGVADDPWNSGRSDIIHGDGTRITAQLGGGALGGLLDVRREMLDPTRAELGRIAAAVVQTVNTQHAQGMDAYGALGTDFFAPLRGLAYAAPGNTGNAAITVGFEDAGALGDGDYLLAYDGSAWALTELRSGQAIALTGTGTVADPLVGAGLALTVSGSAAAGDRYLLRPAVAAAATVTVAIRDPARVAAASPLRATADLANTGTATVSPPAIVDAGDAALLDPVEIRFIDATTYQINGAGSYTHTPGTPIQIHGWSLTVAGTPAAGDRFTVRAAGPDSGDNTNARALAALGQAAVLAGGTRSVLQAHTALVARVGVGAQQAQMRLDAQTAIGERTRAEREATSGVNLDEEAADLLRFQQAYQAAARVIQVADTVFQSLLRAADG
ncbi:flagellar hook-associated protein 1 FlgK [Fontimonas thermophila]|uniref:Flagellar hook-associated protein 1 n=1 Tax=Fontimonas thermophila TaxID=1076937 RepID=A0A1I2JNK0_9GAMM|nr:flagellar hook-associated protein FlgK [Fontimonas thermophila]SFF55510.1 flagellar hook-associated protein 1 FlgK [Fontimonas thermophila]